MTLIVHTGKQIIYDKCPWACVTNAFLAAQHQTLEREKAVKLQKVSGKMIQK